MSAPLPADVVARLEVVGAARRLLVCLDYDGTLADIVADPDWAVPAPDAIDAVAALAALPDTVVALLSGRSLASLRALVDPPAGVRLVGSHGLEFDDDPPGGLSPEEGALLGRIRAGVRELVDGVEGARLEDKPAGVAVHVRQCPEAIGDRVLHALVAGPATWPGVHVMHGKRVAELSVRPLGKGEALTRLRREVAPTATLVVGDDVTDEDAFAVLRDTGGPADLSVKVGRGATIADLRVEGTPQVVEALRLLGRLRAADHDR